MVQVNISDYGDSRIIKPSKSEEKDVVRTKSGRRNTVMPILGRLVQSEYTW